MHSDDNEDDNSHAKRQQGRKHNFDIRQLMKDTIHAMHQTVDAMEIKMNAW